MKRGKITCGETITCSCDSENFIEITRTHTEYSDDYAKVTKTRKHAIQCKNCEAYIDYEDIYNQIKDLNN